MQSVLTISAHVKISVLLECARSSFMVTKAHTFV